MHDQADGDEEEEEKGRHGKAQEAEHNGERQRCDGLRRHGPLQPGQERGPEIVFLGQAALDLGPCTGLVPTEHAASGVLTGRGSEPGTSDHGDDPRLPAG
ncbi:hypothetical protein, partial [Pseudonocardia sp.]|uniref:hypothetical protein n=1 Tax=Pseudonocardia sp. TaxID=60912 RepID=UPI002610B83B